MGGKRSSECGRKNRRGETKGGEGSFKMMRHLFTGLVGGEHKRGLDEEGLRRLAKNTIKK